VDRVEVPEIGFYGLVHLSASGLRKMKGELLDAWSATLPNRIASVFPVNRAESEPKRETASSLNKTRTSSYRIMIGFLPWRFRTKGVRKLNVLKIAVRWV
jgi:hypothetical protein